MTKYEALQVQAQLQASGYAVEVHALVQGHALVVVQVPMTVGAKTTFHEVHLHQAHEAAGFLRKYHSHTPRMGV